jgi:hypothetical protein
MNSKTLYTKTIFSVSNKKQRSFHEIFGGSEKSLF